MSAHGSVIALDRGAVGPHVRSLALCLSLGTVVGGALSLASWVLSGDIAARLPQTVEFVIPAGTATRIEAGEGAPAIPPDFTFLVGDTLVLRNEDSAAHAMGPYPVQAGSTLRIPLLQATTRSYLCTFHPQGAVDLVVKSRPDLMPLVWSTLLLGLPLGGGAAGVLWVARSLDAVA